MRFHQLGALVSVSATAGEEIPIITALYLWIEVEPLSTGIVENF